MYEALHENDKKTSCAKSMPCFSGIWKGYIFQQKVCERGTISVKMVYKRVRG